MARGIIVGRVTDDSSAAAVGAQISLLNINGAFVNGVQIPFKVPKVTAEVGSGWFKTPMPVESRESQAEGLFAIPFSWDSSNADVFARVVGNDSMTFKIIAQKGQDYRTSWGKACWVPDLIQMLNNIKTGQLMMKGEVKPIFDKLKPQFKNLITGKEFEGIPFTMLSTEQIAIVGVIDGAAP